MQDLSGDLSVATREVFGNIAPWMRAVFYALMAASMAVLGVRLGSRVRLWWQGGAGGFETDWRRGLRRLVVYAAGQKRVHRKSLGAVLHLLLFTGFIILTIGTTLLMIAHAGPVDFHVGWYYLFYELTLDVFGVAFCVGCGLALYRRWVRRPASLGHQANDYYLLGLLLALGLTGFAVEALRLHYTQVPGAVARWSVVGWGIERVLLRSMDVETTRGLHLAVWWLHSGLVALFFATLPVTRFLHVITGPLNIALRPERPVGQLTALSLEEVERTGRIGTARVADFNRQQLLSLDACMECGRCEDACPAWASGKPLSPKKVIVDLRAAMERAGPDPGLVAGGTISAETLWACTMCQACVQECPVLIGHVDLIGDMRRHLVGEGQIAGPPAVALRHVAGRFNPYGRPNTERLQWAEGLAVPTVESNPGYETLYWVGCAAAFDPRAQKAARALVQLLQRAGVNFAVLGDKERCTGDVARRLGDEFLFQELAQTNLATLQQHRARSIVTACPHCYNTLRHEYPQLGGRFEVRHHTQLLAELIATGRLEPAADRGPMITLHDPCYLARANDETAAPRQVLRAAGAPVQEMPRNGRKTFCCGAGGGRMWFDEPPGQRVSGLRMAEAASTGAQQLATACPFCLNMMSDAAATAGSADPMPVRDVAEILWETQPAAGSPGGSR